MFEALTPADLDALDPAALKAMILAQREMYIARQAEHAAEIQSQTAALSSRASEIERLKLLVEKLQRMLFGTKSEKVLRQIEQLELQLEELQVATAADLQHLAARSGKSAPAKPFRRPLPEHLPREIHTHMPEHDACPDCGGKLRDLGEDAAEMLDYVRASFKVIRHVRPKRSCQGWNTPVLQNLRVRHIRNGTEPNPTSAAINLYCHMACSVPVLPGHHRDDKHMTVIRIGCRKIDGLSASGSQPTINLLLGLLCVLKNWILSSCS